MPGIVRLGDTCTGHDCWPSRANTSASPNVFINGLGAHRVGDSWETHCCPGSDCHSGSQASGSPNVFVNGLSVARIGDFIDCGSSNQTGSQNVFAN